MTLLYGSSARMALVCTAALALAACGSSGSYRVASVGSTPSDGSAGDGSGGSSTAGDGGSGSANTGGSGSGSDSGSGQRGQSLLVTAGNAMMGTAGTLDGAPGVSAIPASGVVTGTVDRVLTRTGQTLVRLGDGNSVLLNGVGGRVGEAVSLDLGEGKVVGGSSPLVGLNVLARNPSTGQLATVGAGTGGNLVSVTVPQSGVNGLVGSTVNTAGGVVNGATGAAGTPITAGVTGNAAAGNNGVATAVNGVANGTTGSGLNATVNAVTQPATATINAALNPR